MVVVVIKMTSLLMLITVSLFYGMLQRLCAKEIIYKAWVSLAAIKPVLQLVGVVVWRLWLLAEFGDVRRQRGWWRGGVAQQRGVVGDQTLFHPLLLLHAAVLEPDLDLGLIQLKRPCDLYPARPRQVLVEVKLFLQLSQLFRREVGPPCVVDAPGPAGATEAARTVATRIHAVTTVTIGAWLRNWKTKQHFISTSTHQQNRHICDLSNRIFFLVNAVPTLLWN